MMNMTLTSKEFRVHQLQASQAGSEPVIGESEAGSATLEPFGDQLGGQDEGL